MSEGAIAPGLLVAMPQLEDPNFHRSVVLMMRHDEQGSFGVVVNRPSDVAISEVLDSLEIAWRGDALDVVWTGGPVMPQTGLLLHQPIGGEGEDAGSLEVAPGIAISTTPDRLERIAADPPAHVRFLMGHAGWGPGQLEEELAQGAWILADATAELIFDVPAARMWESVLRTLGLDPGALVPGPGVH